MMNPSCQWPIRTRCTLIARAWAFGALCLALAACASTARKYPTAAVKDSDPNVEFKVLLEAPQAYKGRLLQIAGEITRVQPVEGKIQIEAKRKWIQKQPQYPGYQPLEIGSDPADMFLLVYSGKIDPGGLMIGNKFVTAADLLDSRAAKNLNMIAVQALCLHVWKTGEKKITYFTDRYNQVYAPLEQETYCIEGSEAALAQLAQPPVPASLASPAPEPPRPPTPQFGEGQRVRPTGVVSLGADAAGAKSGQMVGPETLLTVVDGELQDNAWVYHVVQGETGIRGWIREDRLAPTPSSKPSRPRAPHRSQIRPAQPGDQPHQ